MSCRFSQYLNAPQHISEGPTISFVDFVAYCLACHCAQQLQNKDTVTFTVNCGIYLQLVRSCTWHEWKWKCAMVTHITFPQIGGNSLCVHVTKWVRTLPVCLQLFHFHFYKFLNQAGSHLICNFANTHHPRFVCVKHDVALLLHQYLFVKVKHRQVLFQFDVYWLNWEFYKLHVHGWSSEFLSYSSLS